MPDTPLCPALPEGDRAKREAAARGGKPEQRIAVGQLPFGAFAQHRLVAGELHIARHLQKGEIDERVEPVERERREEERLYKIVPPPDMGALMGENIARLPLGKIQREIDLRPEETADEGGRDPVALIEVAGEPHGGCEFAAQAQIGEQAVARHQQRAAEPDEGEHGARGEALLRGRGCGGRCSRAPLDCGRALRLGGRCNRKTGGGDSA